MFRKFFVCSVLVLGLAGGHVAFGQAVAVDDPKDIADTSGDISRIEAWVDGANLNLAMTVQGVFAPSVDETPPRMANRYYYHWLLDTDNNSTTGYNNSEYEGNATGVETPIGVDVVVQFGWRDGATNGVYAYDPLTEETLFEDYAYTIEGDTIQAVIPLADLGLTPDDTIAVSAFQEGASNDWEVDWVESAVLSLEAPEPVNPGSAGLVLSYDFEVDANDVSGGGNDGVLLGDAAVMDGLLVLDGDDDAIAIPRIGGEDAVYSNISYGMWIYPTTDLTPLTFSGGMNTSPWGAGAVHLKANNGVINVGINGLAGGDLVGTTIIDPNTWSHLALTVSDTKVAIYLNGQVEDSRDLAAPLENLVLGSATLGAWDNGGDVQREMAGFMDNVVVYERSLSMNEVQWLAGIRPEVVDPGTEGLVAYYPLDGDTDDASGNELHGTIVGEPVFVDGAIGSALDLDGVDDHVDCGNSELFSVTDAFTLSVWINWRAPGATWQTVIAKGDNAWRLARGGDTQTMDFGFTGGGDRGWQAARTASEVPLGEWHHVAATIDTAEGAKIYLNGVLEGTNPDTGGITVGDYPVLIGENAQATGRFWDGSVDEVAIYSRALTAGEILYLAGYRSDVTMPGDAVQGVPNDGDWPGAETPDLAIDDNVETKYLHFKGDFDPDAGPTGIQVTPAVGATVVTGLTFTTANDATERDPIAFELSGSNDGIDGPYTVIASGFIVDFGQDEAWPRFTKNEAPIAFYNTAAYTNYQILITAIRDADSANSMQIAEIELVGKPVD